jgi:ABC-type transport system substrate-binding protein
MSHRWFKSPKGILSSFLVLGAMLFVACGGTAAEPTVIEKEVIVEKEVIKEVQVIKEVPVIKEVVREILKEVPVETVVERLVVATPTPIPANKAPVVEAKVNRVIYAFGEVQETNRHWTVGRPSYYQFDPWAETLIGLDPTDNSRTPRLAKNWEWSPDGREWIFQLEEDVPFHFGYGEFTSKDVIAAFDRHIGPDSQAGSVSFFKDANSVEALGDHEVKFTMNGIAIDMPAMVSRGFGGGEFLILSANQFEKDGLEGYDEQPAGTGTYQYGGRNIGESIWFERINYDHWRGERPDFSELEIRWVREDITRLAMLLTGEAHIASMSRELQLEAARAGMKAAQSGVPTNYLVMFFGGMYFSEGDPDYDPTVPWANPDTGKQIRQAMNKAINRQEMLDFVLRGEGEIMRNMAFLPILGGYNSKWDTDWEELYGFDPEKAKALMAEAGYSPENPMEFTIFNYISSDEPETPVMVEALINYWEPIGVKVNLVDSEWGTVRKNYRGKTAAIKKGGWGNVITMRALTTRLRAWSSTVGTSRNYESDVIDKAYTDFLALETADQDKIDALVQTVGDDRYYNFPDIPFFWFRLTVMYNPDVVASWTFPGTSGSKTSHWNLIKAAQ